MERVVAAKPVEGYRIEVEFSDGVKGIVDLSDRMYGPLFEPLKDPAMFRNLSIDSYGVICWENGADLAPDALYSQLTGGDQDDRRVI